MKVIYKTDEYLPVFSEFLNNINESHLSKANIDSFYICTNDNYRNTVKEIDSTQDVTINDNYQGVGKTLYKDNRNIIVLKEIIPKIINVQFLRIEDIKKCDIGLQSAYDILFHEIGHAHDNCKRNITVDQTYDSYESFKIMDYLNFYFNNISCEYNAESYVRQIVSDDYVKSQLDSLVDDYKIMINTLNQNKTNFKDNIRNHALSNITAFSTFFTRYSILLSLSNRSRTIEWFLESSKTLFFNDIGKELFDDYYQKSTMHQQILELCLLNFQNYGFKFVVNDGSNDSFFY
jgi:hypothetical protein